MSTLLLAKSYFFTPCRTGGKLCHRQNNADTAEPNDSAVSASLNRILFESILIGARLSCGFRAFVKIKKSVKNRFDHSLSHNREKFNKYPGVAQLGARVVWEQVQAGSTPVIPTISPP